MISIMILSYFLLVGHKFGSVDSMQPILEKKI